MDRAEGFSTFRQTFEFPSSKSTLNPEDGTFNTCLNIVSLQDCTLLIPESRSYIQRRQNKLRGKSQVLFLSLRQFSHYEISVTWSFITKRISSAWLLTRKRTRSSAIPSEQKREHANVNGRKRMQLKLSHISICIALACVLFLRAGSF
jgi:hypothetical protein